MTQFRLPVEFIKSPAPAGNANLRFGRWDDLIAVTPWTTIPISLKAGESKETILQALGKVEGVTQLRVAAPEIVQDR